MTRHLVGEPIPKQVMTPPSESLNQDSRIATVYGVSVVEKCLNEECQRVGPIDALILGPLNLWPNIAVICGDDGCGVYWALIGAPPKETVWIHIDNQEQS